MSEYDDSWVNADPRKKGESWEQAARRTGRLLNQQIPYLAAHGIVLDGEAENWTSGTFTVSGDPAAA